MKDAIDRTIGIIDETSSVIACSELGRIGEPSGVEYAEVIEAVSGIVKGRATYFPLWLGAACRVCRVCGRRG